MKIIHTRHKQKWLSDFNLIQVSIVEEPVCSEARIAFNNLVDAMKEWVKLTERHKQEDEDNT